MVVMKSPRQETGGEQQVRCVQRLDLLVSLMRAS